ncbi:phenylacetate-CoA oxygenase subunit PaaI, partial [Salibacterium salarium]
YEPLALTAQKVLMEQTYHLAHWKVWVEQLQQTTDEATERLQQRLTEAWDEILDMIELGPKAADMNRYGLIEEEKVLQERWLYQVKQIISLSIPAMPGKAKGSGRACEHTSDLDQALAVLSEVYDSDKEAIW